MLAVCSIPRKVARGGTELTYRSRWRDLHLDVFWGLLALTSHFALSVPLLKLKLSLSTYRGSIGVTPLILNLCIM